VHLRIPISEARAYPTVYIVKGLCFEDLGLSLMTVADFRGVDWENEGRHNRESDGVSCFIET
jgi:hypothetical protein